MLLLSNKVICQATLLTLVAKMKTSLDYLITLFKEAILKI